MKIFLPKDFKEETNELVFKIAHSTPDVKVFWYLDEHYIGTTQTFHEMGLRPRVGTHIITATDEMGNQIKREIEITD